LRKSRNKIPAGTRGLADYPFRRAVFGPAYFWTPLAGRSPVQANSFLLFFNDFTKSTYCALDDGCAVCQPRAEPRRGQSRRVSWDSAGLTRVHSITSSARKEERLPGRPQLASFLQEGGKSANIHPDRRSSGESRLKISTCPPPSGGPCLWFFTLDA
jgi:hypothetical protein